MSKDGGGGEGGGVVRLTHTIDPVLRSRQQVVHQASDMMLCMIIPAINIPDGNVVPEKIYCYCMSKK